SLATDLLDQRGMQVGDRRELLLEPEPRAPHALEESLLHHDVEHPPALRQRRDIRRYAGPFAGKEAAGAAHARLDLVEDQEQPVRVAEAAEFSQLLVRDG